MLAVLLKWYDKNGEVLLKDIINNCNALRLSSFNIAIDLRFIHSHDTKYNLLKVLKF